MLHLSLKILLETFIAPIHTARNKRALRSTCAKLGSRCAIFTLEKRELYVRYARALRSRCASFTLEKRELYVRDARALRSRCASFTLEKRELYVRDARALRSRYARLRSICASFTLEMRETEPDMREFYFREAHKTHAPHVKCPLLLP